MVVRPLVWVVLGKVVNSVVSVVDVGIVDFVSVPVVPVVAPADVVLSVVGIVVDVIEDECMPIPVDVMSEVVVSSVVCVDSDIPVVVNCTVVDLGVTDYIVGVESVVTSVVAVVELAVAVIRVVGEDVVCCACCSTCCNSMFG